MKTTALLVIFFLPTSETNWAVQTEVEIIPAADLAACEAMSEAVKSTHAASGDPRKILAECHSGE